MLAKIRSLSLPLMLGLALGTPAARAQPAATQAPGQQVPAPMALVQHLTESVMDAVRSDPQLKAGNEAKIDELVQTKVLPYLDFQQMTASAVGPYWRRATPQQREQLQQQFKELLVHTYSGAIKEIRNQQVQYLPLRAAPGATSVVVHTRVINNGDLIQLDYRVVKLGKDWKIFDVNVMGVWLVDNYRGVFAQEINSKGIDGLIQVLEERNKELAQARQGGQ